MKTIATSFGLALAIAGSAKAQTQVFACMPIDATGFHAEKPSKTYRRSGFAAEKFLMTVSDDRKQLVVKIRGKEEVYTCSKPWVGEDIIQCSEELYFMGFDLKSHDFTRAQILGPLGGAGADSISVSYGSCQKF